MNSNEMNSWNKFPGTASYFGLKQTMKNLNYHNPEQARRVIRQAYVRGKELSDLSSSEQAYLELNFCRGKGFDFRLYRDCVFIYNKDGSLITVYPVRFPKVRFIGKKQVGFKEYKSYQRNLDRELEY